MSAVRKTEPPESETPENDARLRKAVRAVHDARAHGAELQPQTVAAGGLEAKVTDYVAIEVGKDGATKIHRSQVTALFNKRSCACVRLWADGQIGDDGMRAALRFAAALDRVYGAFRVRTVDWDRVTGIGLDGLSSPERDAQARRDHDDARDDLGVRLFTILNAVMRFDMTAADAAAKIYGDMRTEKLIGMGDAALIEATGRLAALWGFSGEAGA